MIGDGQYAGKTEEFDNNKKIIDFLTNNHVK